MGSFSAVGEIETLNTCGDKLGRDEKGRTGWKRAAFLL
jgi:hypothetical protein